MTECVPGVTLTACEFPELKQGDDKILEVASALTIAAVHVVTETGGCVDHQSVTWGSTGAQLPNCCNVVQTGIQTSGQRATTDFEQACYSPHRVRWEVLVSQCRPKIEGRTIPASGFGQETPPIDSVTGHAFHMHRITTSAQLNLLRLACCMLDQKCTICSGLRITAVDSNTQACEQVRFTIETAQ